MRGKVILSAVAAACLGAVPVQASPAAADKSPNSEKKICKKEAPSTGSRLGATRICATEAEWRAREEITEDARAQLERTQTQRPIRSD
jgi:hypothetical protein